MPSQQIDLPGIGTVKLYKHKKARAIRITIGSDSYVRVTLPRWLPYRAGIEFVQSKQAWIATHRKPAVPLAPGQAIGKAHRLYFLPSLQDQRISSRLRGSELRISHPADLAHTHASVQAAARRAALKALKLEAEALLPTRLEQLAMQHGFTYQSVVIKQLKSRWGSCNHKQDITLNCFLMQLPWDLIDYVLLHELVHTKVLHHGPDFWRLFESVLPSAKQRRKLMKTYQTAL